MKKEKRYWLMKTEPSAFGIDDLARVRREPWSGVRNFQARNYMRDEMQVGDTVPFYHSSCPQPGIYGLAKVASKAYPDPTQFDKKGHYFEPRATVAKPVWYLVDVAFVRKLKTPLLLSDLKKNTKLHTMLIFRPGSRLSITPVTAKEFEEIQAQF
jgi:predicted RNA-binding protein with PUA-like domain